MCPCVDPQLAAPSAEVVSSLEALCEDPANCVLVISGRKKEDLQEWLGHIPQLGGGGSLPACLSITTTMVMR